MHHSISSNHIKNQKDCIASTFAFIYKKHKTTFASIGASTCLNIHKSCHIKLKNTRGIHVPNILDYLHPRAKQTYQNIIKRIHVRTTKTTSQKGASMCIYIHIKKIHVTVLYMS